MLKTRVYFKTWNGFIFACYIVVSLSSFVFGYNIGVINQPTQVADRFPENILLKKLTE